MGRPRDGDDRVAWLLQRRRFREALAIASTDRSLRKHNRPQVVSHQLYLREYESVLCLNMFSTQYSG